MVRQIHEAVGGSSLAGQPLDLASVSVADSNRTVPPAEILRMDDGRDRAIRIVEREKDGPILQLDPLGDTIMVITDRSRHVSRTFLVSSRILSLASPVFTVMFKPDPRETRQTVRLDDDPETMGWMLSILHHQCADVPLSIHPRVLARLAIHCDKYDCCMALRAWSSHWCNMLQSPNTPEDIGHILLAAYMLRAPNLSGLAAQAAIHLAPDFQAAWKRHEILKLLPETFPARLAQHVASKLRVIQEELQNAENSLREQRRPFEMIEWFCMRCGAVYPAALARCSFPRCHGEDIVNKGYCTSNDRVAEYFAVLRRCDLWPTTKPFATCPLAHIAARVAGAEDEAGTRHHCGGGAHCPLRRELRRLDERVQAVIGSLRKIPFTDQP